MENRGYHFEEAEFEAHFRDQGKGAWSCMCKRSFGKVFSLSSFGAGRYVAVLEYAHLAVRLDLEKAIGKVKEACENIQRSTEHMRRKAEGMDIHAMMQRQERLCMSFAQQMYGQIYALGKEIHVRGIPDPFQMRRSKRKFGEEPETYSETLRRLKEENYDVLLESSRASILKTVETTKKTVCNESNLMSDERSDYLQVRCCLLYTSDAADE